MIAPATSSDRYPVARSPFDTPEFSGALGTNERLLCSSFLNDVCLTFVVFGHHPPLYFTRRNGSLVTLQTTTATYLIGSLSTEHGTHKSCTNHRRTHTHHSSRYTLHMHRDTVRTHTHIRTRRCNSLCPFGCVNCPWMTIR